jgi:hypothetical protein
LTVSVALTCRLRLEAPYGDAILLAAALSILLGELVGPTSLRRALDRAGELPARSLDEAPADEGAPAA